jgi:transitional endoplasmic reticulum ATPase
LLGCGVIQEKKATGSDLDDHFRINDLVLDALRRCQGGMEELLPMVLGQAAKPALEWADFDHLGPVAEKACAFLRQALQRQQTGVNILLWGPPGTGKTEFCKILSQQTGTCLYAVGEQNPDGEEPSRDERLTNFRLAQALLRSHPDAILLFDEMDDLCDGIGWGRLFGVTPRMGSKAKQWGQVRVSDILSSPLCNASISQTWRDRRSSAKDTIAERCLIFGGKSG